MCECKCAILKDCLSIYGINCANRFLIIIIIIYKSVFVEQHSSDGYEDIRYQNVFFFLFRSFLSPDISPLVDRSRFMHNKSVVFSSLRASFLRKLHHREHIFGWIESCAQQPNHIDKPICRTIIFAH